MTTRKRNKNYNPDGKLCINCLVPLNKENTRECDVAQGNYICLICRKLRDKQRYQDKKEIIREQQRTYDFAVRLKVIEAYGGECVCCGEKSAEFLTIDHINEESNRLSGTKLYRWLIQNGYPKNNYQLLCYNCNCAKSSLGYCPHSPPKDGYILAGINALKASVFDGSTSESAVSRSPDAKLL